MKKFYSILSILLVFCLLLTPFAVWATDGESQSDQPALQEADLSHAGTVLLYCIETDTVLRAKNIDGKIYPATAVKLMTALVAYEEIRDLKAEITVTREMVAGVSGNYYGFTSGDTVSAEDLLKLLLMRKSNDAALILAYAATGSIDSFVDAMNAKAKALGMENTGFTNCTGLHDAAMTTTAEDLLKLSLAFYSNSQLQTWSGSGNLTCESLNNRTIYNSNYFLSRYYNGTGKSYLFDAVSGLINGSTTQSGELLITSAAYNGMHYIVVLAGGETVDDLPSCYDITRDLIQLDTQNFAFSKVLSDAEVICELPVLLGSDADYAAVFPKQTLEYYLPKNLDSAKFRREISLTAEALEAPVAEGDLVGSIRVYYDGDFLGETQLVVRSNITRSGTEYRIAQITAFLSSQLFFVISMSVIGLALVYFIVTAIYRDRVKKKYGKES